MSLEIRLSPEQLAELGAVVAAELKKHQSAALPKLAYSIEEAAIATAKTPWQIRTSIRAGELHAHQSGSRGAYSIPHDALLAWLNGTRRGRK